MSGAGVVLQLAVSVTGMATIAVLLLWLAAWLDDHEANR